MPQPPREQPRYDEHDRERWVPEARKRPQRSDFERDRARVVHSAALRRLSATTQVVLPWTDDFVRNRLTHSLEVAQVGRELGRALGCEPDVVDTACLAHDLGHPPFGHNGEQALDRFAASCGGFEGNAQTLRVLTRLEAKTARPGGASAGLNLTRASLDAATKYPWPRGAAPASVPPAKYGLYAAEAEVFAWLRRGAPAARACLEAQVMDWSDDVAYSVHDVEDGVQSGAVDLRALAAGAGRGGVLATARRSYAPDAADDELAAALDRLLALPFWPGGYDGSRVARASLKDLTSQLIGRFCDAAETATRQAYGPGALTRYAADLVVPRDVRLECAVLKGVAARFVMDTEDRLAAMAGQRELLDELAGRLAADAPDTLAPAFQADWREAADDAARLRVVVDQVASLSDPSAVALHAALTGRPTQLAPLSTLHP